MENTMAESRPRLGRLLNKREAAERLSVSIAEINRLMALGRLGYVKPTGTKMGPVRFTEEVLTAWVRQNTFIPAEQKGGKV
jgi:excisionase family DNA binding protein